VQCRSRASFRNAPMLLTSRQSRPMAQGQMPTPRRIRGGRLDRSRRKPAVSRRPAARPYDPDGRLVYAGRAGTDIKQAELARLWRQLHPLATSEMPLAVPPPRDSRVGSPLVLSRVHWVRPELVAEVKYLTWTADSLLRQLSMKGYATTSQRPRCDVKCRIPHQSCVQ